MSDQPKQTNQPVNDLNNSQQDTNNFKNFFKDDLFGKGDFQRERVGWGPLSAVVIFLVAMFIGATFYSIVEVVYAQLTNQDLVEVGSLISISLMPFILVWPVLLTVFGFVFYKERSIKKVFTSLGFKKVQIGQLITIVLSSIFFVYLFNIILSLIISVDQEVVGQIEEQQKTVIDSLMIIIGVCVVVPIYEEVLTRGLLFAGLRKKLAFFPAALISGFLFAVLHFEGSLNNVLSITAAMVFISFILAWSYEKTNSLWPAIIIHGIMNFTVVLFTL